MTICVYPLWTVLLIGIGVFFASFIDTIGGGGGIISVPVYLLAGLPTHFALGTNKLSASIGTAASTFRYVKNGSKIVRPVILVVLALLAVKIILELFGAA